MLGLQCSPVSPPPAATACFPTPTAHCGLGSHVSSTIRNMWQQGMVAVLETGKSQTPTREENEAKRNFRLEHVRNESVLSAAHSSSSAPSEHTPSPAAFMRLGMCTPCPEGHEVAAFPSEWPSSLFQSKVSICGVLIRSKKVWYTLSLSYLPKGFFRSENVF